MSVEHLTVFGAQDATLTGGAIALHAGSLPLTGVTIAGELADRGGGIAVGPRGQADSGRFARDRESGGLERRRHLERRPAHRHGVRDLGNLAGDGGGI